MKRIDAQSIAALLNRYLREEGLETPLNERRLIDSWPKVMGPMIARYTKELFIKNQVLYVYLSSSVLRQELSMGRQLVVRKLNAAVGANVITDVVFC